MGKTQKRLVAIVLAAVMMLSFAACGKEFDAKGYVQAVMDAKYQRNYDAYAKAIGMTVEEAKEQMEGEFNESLEQEVQSSGMEATEEEIAQYQQLEADFRAKIKYEVKDAVKDDDDNYTVDVEVTPNNAYSLLQDGIEAKLTEAMNNGVDMNGFMGVFLEFEKECIDNSEELDPITVTLHVTYEEKGNQRIYSISDDEMMDLDQKIMGQ